MAFNQLRIPLLNSPGTLLLGHKAFLPFVGEMISFYCGEDPILQSPPTYILRNGLLPKDVDNWVLKTATGCQGDGVFVLKSQPSNRLQEIRSSLFKARGRRRRRLCKDMLSCRVYALRVRQRDNTYDVELRALAYIIGWQQVFVGEHSMGSWCLQGAAIEYRPYSQAAPMCLLSGN